MTRPNVDILLPYWGKFTLFKETVDSVLNQSHTEWRLLIFDDHYPSDEAKQYCSSLDDKRIIYYRHSKNIGITNNFNFALQKASADYCIMLGCDDRLLPNYLEVALKNIGNADFYQPMVEVIDEKGQIYLPLGDRIKRLLQPRKAGFYTGEKLATSLCHGNWLYFPSIFWKTSSIKRYGFNAKYKIVEDVVLELNLIKDGASLYFDKNNTTFQYRRFENSLSSVERSKEGVRFQEEDEAYATFVPIFKMRGWNTAARAASLHLTSRIHKLLAKIH